MPDFGRGALDGSDGVAGHVKFGPDGAFERRPLKGGAKNR